MNEQNQFEAVYDEQLQKLEDRLLNLEPIPDSPACPKCAVYHEHLDVLRELAKKLSERRKELVGKVSVATSHIEGADAARDLLLDQIERRQQGMPPTLAQVINRALLAECREIGRTPRRNAESEIEYPVEALDKVMSAWTDRNALHKLCKGALMAMTELTEAELTDMTVSAPEAPIPPATEVAGFLGASSVNVEPMMNVPGKSVLSADQVRGMLEVMPGMALYWDDYGHVSVARNEEFERLPPGDQNRLLKQFIAALHLEAGLEV